MVKHIHKLKRHRYAKTKTEVYFCTLPDCQHKIECALAVGKVSICNLCGKEFVMNEYTVKLARPHCEPCSKRKVVGPDGKNHYVRENTLPILASVGVGDGDDLRSRLNDVVTPNTEEDI